MGFEARDEVGGGLLVQNKVNSAEKPLWSSPAFYTV
jgi:hypothetical protein